MKVFISWSGLLSKELGEIFNNWIPCVLQFVRPYFTPDDVEKGSRWASEIAKELQESQIGILVLTRDNLSSPSIMFEAGALSKQLDKSKICTILFDLEKIDLTWPLAQFQATSFGKKDMKKLVETINNACGDSKLEETVLRDAFEMWWPRLEEQVRSVMGKTKGREHTTIRSDRELIEEILSLMRVSLDLRSRTRKESGEYIHPGAVDDLVRRHEDLKRAVESKNMAEIEELCGAIAMPIDYIVARLRGGAETKGEVIMEVSPTIRRVRRIKEEEERKGA